MGEKEAGSVYGGAMNVRTSAVLSPHLYGSDIVVTLETVVACPGGLDVRGRSRQCGAEMSRGNWVRRLELVSNLWRD